MRKKFCWLILLLGGACGLLSCLVHPEQPKGAQPYARLVLPEAIRLVALDNQTFDARLRLREIQVTPGSHTLHLAYADNSSQHAGQQHAPLRFEVQAGHQYVFEARTGGIIWRPVVVAHTLIPEYCTVHACTEAETQAPQFEPSNCN